MTIDAGLFAWLEESLEPVGRVTMRKMMGGATLYLDGTIFAILAADELWFKADAASDALWDAQGCPRFTVAFKDGKVETMNYRRAPADVHDDADAMRHWARIAQEAGLRGAARKRPPPGRGSPTRPAPAGRKRPPRGEDRPTRPG